MSLENHLEPTRSRAKTIVAIAETHAGNHAEKMPTESKKKEKKKMERKKKKRKRRKKRK